MLIVKVYNLSDKKLPQYETRLSAGMDVRVDFSRNSLSNPVPVKGAGQFIPANEVQKTSILTLEPGSRALIPTGICMKIPEGYECQVRPRSGLAWKEGITVLNTPGTIDADYTNEVGVIVMNTSSKTVIIEDNERIAQLVFAKTEACVWEQVGSKDDLGNSGHGTGIGHTGKK